jgi:hypothetical protein
MNKEDQDGSETPKGSSTNRERIDKRKPDEGKLTFNLLLLHLEGLVCLLSLAMQLEVRGLLLLEGLALVLVRDADPHQLPVEMRHLLLLLLERRPRLVERGTLPLELAQRFLARQAPLLERGPSLEECGPLPLKLAVHLLAYSWFLPELLLRRGERGSLVRQGRLQPLSLLERRAALLELGAGGGDFCLPRRREGACPL